MARPIHNKTDQPNQTTKHQEYLEKFISSTSSWRNFKSTAVEKIRGKSTILYIEEIPLFCLNTCSVYGIIWLYNWKEIGCDFSDCYLPSSNKGGMSYEHNGSLDFIVSSIHSTVLHRSS